jgi:hypothetical protein
MLTINKEFEGRSKPTEIVAGGKSCYSLLSFVAFKDGSALEVCSGREG